MAGSKIIGPLPAALCAAEVSGNSAGEQPGAITTGMENDMVNPLLALVDYADDDDEEAEEQQGGNGEQLQQDEVRRSQLTPPPRMRELSLNGCRG